MTDSKETTEAPLSGLTARERQAIVEVAEYVRQAYEVLRPAISLVTGTVAGDRALRGNLDVLEKALARITAAEGDTLTDERERTPILDDRPSCV